MIHVLDDLFVGRHKAFESFAVERAFAAHPLGGDEAVALFCKSGPIDAKSDFAIALEEAPPAVDCKTRLTGHAHQAPDRCGRATDIERRLQHSRHRARRARTYRYQE